MPPILSLSRFLSFHLEKVKGDFTLSCFLSFHSLLSLSPVSCPLGILLHLFLSPSLPTSPLLPSFPCHPPPLPPSSQAALEAGDESARLRAMQAEAMRRATTFDAAASAATTSDRPDGDLDRSRRAFVKDFRRLVEMCDVILEVLDARDPLGCR